MKTHSKSGTKLIFIINHDKINVHYWWGWNCAWWRWLKLSEVGSRRQKVDAHCPLQNKCSINVKFISIRFHESECVWFLVTDIQLLVYGLHSGIILPELWWSWQRNKSTSNLEIGHSKTKLPIASIWPLRRSSSSHRYSSIIARTYSVFEDLFRFYGTFLPPSYSSNGKLRGQMSISV